MFSDGSKVTLNEQQQLILTEKGAAALSGGYLQIVGHDGLYVDKQSLPKLMEQGVFDRSKSETKLQKNDEEVDSSSVQRDSDGETKYVYKFFQSV